ncbi:MAG TPA: ribosome maturation factor RimP [Pseudomonadales bacterium]|jgi:ribosome maturation factor RimP|nr:ribosome maturation factor RimP [Pseudomonadales bacterium]
MTKKERELETLLSPTVAALGLRVWGIEYLGQGKHSVLRIYIDRDEGVTIEDCEAVSKQVSEVLDVEGTLTSSYTLEVSSPGMDRLLFKPEQYAESIGETVDVRLNYPFEGRRRVVGALTGLENDEVVVQAEDSEYQIPLSNVQRARIVPRFE